MLARRKRVSAGNAIKIALCDLAVETPLVALNKAIKPPAAATNQRSAMYRRLESKFRKSLAVGRLLAYDLQNLLRSRSKQNEQIDGRSSFFPICFACSKHFELLQIALQSLCNWALPVKEITIYMDKTDPFSAEQCELLQAASRYPLKFLRTKYPMAPSGIRVVLNELYAFRRLAAHMRSKDFLLKFDSDVIFLSDSVFQFVANAGAEAIGTCVTEIHPTLRDKYMQGGSYFIAGTAVRTIVCAWTTTTGVSLLKRRPYLSEDQFMSSLLYRNGTNILYDTFMYSDNVLAEPGLGDKEIDARLPAIPKNTSVLHFEGNKSNMRRAAERLVPHLSPVLTQNRRYAGRYGTGN